MLSISVSWNSIKQKEGLRYVEAHGNYYIYAVEGNTEWSCVLPLASAVEFESNYKNSATNLA